MSCILRDVRAVTGANSPPSPLLLPSHFLHHPTTTTLLAPGSLRIDLSTLKHGLFTERMARTLHWLDGLALGHLVRTYCMSPLRHPDV